MKGFILVLAPPALALTTLAGCASTAPPPAELRDARATYNHVESGPAAQHNRAGLIEAQQALDAAEQEYADSPSSDKVKTLGYVAQRKAEVADAESRSVIAAQGRLEKQEELTGRSERRAKVALDQLGLAAKDEPRGTVITLETANMFATNEAKILPEAKTRLTEVAEAVSKVLTDNAPQDVGRKIQLVGYTDNTGSDEHNLELSKRRAEAVSAFFAKHGVNSAMMETDGHGPAEPIADNMTPEGRAKNRRVEIVITPTTAKPDSAAP